MPAPNNLCKPMPDESDDSKPTRLNKLHVPLVALGLLVVGLTNLHHEPKSIIPSVVSTAEKKAKVVYNYQTPAQWQWLSTDPILRPQEERQVQWETNKRKQVDMEVYEVVRSNFHQKVLKSASKISNQALQEAAATLLKKALESFGQPGYDATDQPADPAFDDIIVAVDLDSVFMEPGNGRGQGKKALVGEAVLQQLNGTCVVYGAGIDYETGFEAEIAQKFGCAVHAFDCTMNDDARLKEYIERQNDWNNLAFHPWCVGEEEEVPQEELKKSEIYDMSKMSTRMVHLDAIMERLGHKEVDILKFDIEGFEWKLIDSILKGKHLPRQMAFELHTRHANASYVPAHLVAEKGKEAVVELFDKLYKLGYRVVSKELNNGDKRCAEFVVYRFYDDGGQAQH